ncbi:beta-N-acetylhexosaminidase [soil metagenome]
MAVHAGPSALISGCAGPTLSAPEAAFFERYNPWGLILFKRNCETPEQIAALTASYRRAVGRPNALVFIDQEGGRVQRLGPPSNFWRKYPPASAYGALYERNPLQGLRAARHAGRLIAADLHAIGITADCLPVLDVPQDDGHAIIGNRAYGATPERVILLARAHMTGLIEGGVLPVIKHIPGHGRARADSHLTLPVVEATRAELQRIDFPPFAAFADAPMAMTAHVVYTALDKDNPATLSRRIIANVIRRSIGFGGLLMTDDLSMRALSGTMTEKVTRALWAGCDMILHCNGNLDEMTEVAEAAGRLSGKAARRARRALQSVRKPMPYALKTALKDLQALETV